MINCKNCGAQNAENAVFCSSCGIVLKKLEQAPFEPVESAADIIESHQENSEEFPFEHKIIKNTVETSLQGNAPSMQSVPPIPPVVPPPFPPRNIYGANVPYRNAPKRPISSVLLIGSICNTIVSILFSFFTSWFSLASCVLSIIAIVQTVGAQNAIDDLEAEEKLRIARNLNIIADIIIMVGFIITVILGFLGIINFDFLSEIFEPDYLY